MASPPDDATRVYRIVSPKYPPFDGSGTHRWGSRWISPGQFVVHTAESYALAVLENLVHWQTSAVPEGLVCVAADVPRPDDAWAMFKRLSEIDQRVVGIDLSRNFGQHHAITAGIDHARGDWVVVMDCDLQDQPESIRKMYEKAQEGYDVVYGRRTMRQDTPTIKLGSVLFYAVRSYFTDQEFDASIDNFSIVARKVVEAAKMFREQNRNYILTIKWLGFRSSGIEVSHASRPQGKSS